MVWDEETTRAWYAGPTGRRITRRLLRQLKRWPALRWSGREPPAVLAVGLGDELTPLWPGHWELADHRGHNNDASRYDRVVLLQALEVDAHPGELLAACRREVVSGGLVLLLVPNRWSPARWAPAWSPFGAGKGYGARKLARAAHEAGFTLLQQAALVPVWPGGQGSWAWAPGLIRVAVLRKDEPAVTRLKLRPLANPAAEAALSP
jgi:hypothetical protein